MDITRKLVSFRVVSELLEIPGADNIEVALIDGWQCIVKKGDLIPGQRVIYFEIDSLIPVREDFEFLRKYAYVSKSWMQGTLGVSEGFRIKTIKLRGQVSNGLVIKVPKLLEDKDDDFDLTSHYGVVKYEAPASTYSVPLGEGRKGNFPAFIPKTGETRIQNKVAEVMRRKNTSFEVTRKYHGMSMTVYAKLEEDLSFWQKTKLTLSEWLGIRIDPFYKFGVCSHNVELNLNADNIFVQFAINSGLIDLLKEYVKNNKDLPEVAIQGEICGPGIQDNHHGLDEITLFIFNVFDIKNQRYLLPMERSLFISDLIPEHKATLLQEAVVEYITTIGDRTVEEIISLGEYTLPSGKPNEGLVWKSMVDDFSFKAITHNFLLMKE